MLYKKVDFIFQLRITKLMNEDLFPFTPKSLQLKIY